MDDLLILCPNRKWRAVMEVFLSRSRHLGIRDVTAAVKSVPDGGSRALARHGVQLAHPNTDRYHHCLIVLDADQAGDEREPMELSEALEKELRTTWEERCRVIVADPSLDSWLIQGHRFFSRVPGLRGVDVRQALHEMGHWPLGQDVPDQPRHAMESLFEQFGASISAANYRVMADNFPIRLDTIDAPCFRRFVLTLRDWFLP